ncbi:MAG TPA: hypothetical protein VEJ38_09320 [Candidatus Acidoferrales bacterium]|nr:hypothetical protein [Candidatus Acidoferrales bacterium]
MIGLDDVFSTIALGTKLTRAVISLKKHIDALRSGTAREYVQPSVLEALDRRTAELELLASRQTDRIAALEASLEDASAVADALAERMGTVFWLTLMSGSIGLIAIVLSIIAIAHGR